MGDRDGFSSISSMPRDNIIHLWYCISAIENVVFGLVYPFWVVASTIEFTKLHEHDSPNIRLSMKWNILLADESLGAKIVFICILHLVDKQNWIDRSFVRSNVSKMPMYTGANTTRWQWNSVDLRNDCGMMRKERRASSTIGDERKSNWELCSVFSA